MAFIRKQNKDKKGPGMGMLSEGESGVAGGQAETMSSRAPGRTTTKAATPGSWYNIQDYLGANEQGREKMQEDIYGKAQNLIETGREKAEENIGALQGIERPEATQFERTNVPSMKKEDVQKGLSQNWAVNDQSPIDYGQYQVSNQNIQGLNEGSRDDILQFNKAMMEDRSGYTSGMQRMDDLLLGSDPEFVQNFAGDVKGQYASAVTDPLQAQIAQSQQADKEADLALDQARKGWYSGLSDYLGEQLSSVQDTYQSQQDLFNQLEAEEADKLLLDALGDRNLTSSVTGKSYVDPAQYLSKIAPAYASFEGMSPTEQTAAMSALGEEGIGQYNLLSELLGQAAGGEQELDLSEGQYQFDPVTGQAYTAPKWNLDTQGAWDAIMKESAMREVEQDLTPYLEQSQQDIFGKQQQIKQAEQELKNFKNQLQQQIIQQGFSGQGAVNTGEKTQADYLRADIAHRENLIKQLNEQIAAMQQKQGSYFNRRQSLLDSYLK